MKAKKCNITKQVAETDNKVAKSTYNSKVRKYASAFNKAFHDLIGFVETNCKGGEAKHMESLDAICEIVDRYINLNCEVQAWAHKAGVDHADFVCDIENKSFETL